MKIFKTTFAFLFGATLGCFATLYFLKKSYAQRTEQEISSAKEAFHIRAEKLQAVIDELKTQSSEDLDGENTQPTILTKRKIENKGNITDYAKTKYQMYTPQVTQPLADSDEAPKAADDIEAPYVISPDEFGEIGYTQVSLTYYADGILADEQGVIVDDIAEIIGDALEHFGEYEDDSVFCRSDPKRCDYEILLDLRRYADVRKTFPPNI